MKVVNAELINRENISLTIKSKKAKYNNLIRPYMRTVKQGFGSLYGGNQTSDVTNIEDTRTIENENESNFPN